MVRLPGEALVRDGLQAARATAGALAGELLGALPDDRLAERDPDFIRTTLPAYRRVTDVWFRPKVRGLEHIPADGPVLLVGNHSGGTLIADTFVFAFAFYEHFGPDRRFHQLAHDLVFSVPGLTGLRRYGTIPASHEHGRRALRAGAALLVYPGGDHESYRPTSQANEIAFGGRSGFVELALTEDVPIVPVVATGGQETAVFVTRGRRLARLLALDRLLRLKVLPVQFAPPFGLTVLDLPGRLPLPAQITIQVLPPIDVRAEFGGAPERAAVYDRITREMQQALDELADERDLPILGSLGPRRDRSDVADALAGERARR